MNFNIWFFNKRQRDEIELAEKIRVAVESEREACAVFAEGSTAYTQFQTVAHYNISSFIALAIRERSNVQIEGRDALPASRSNAGLGWAMWRRSAAVGEFSSRVLVKREHPYSPGIFRIETVGSEHWVSMSELEYEA